MSVKNFFWLFQIKEDPSIYQGFIVLHLQTQPINFNSIRIDLDSVDEIFACNKKVNQFDDLE